MMTASKTSSLLPIAPFPPKSIQNMSFPHKMPISIPNTTISFSSSHDPHPTTSLEATKQLHALLLRSRRNPLQPDSSPAAQFCSLISAYIKNGSPVDALKVFVEMRKMDSCIDGFVVPSILKACSHIRSIRHGETIHAYSMKSGFDSDVFVQNSLIQLYSECGIAVSARKMFDHMPEKDMVSWSSMIRCYSRNRQFGDALEIVGEMLCLKSRPSEVALLNMLNMFSGMGDLKMARVTHAYAIKNRGTQSVGSGIVVDTSLVDMYAKCGSVDAARKVFDQMVDKNIASWTAMIAGLIRTKKFAEGLDLFVDMHEEGIFPNEITMLSLIIECGAVGAFEIGEQMHTYLLKKGYPMTTVIATALVDMYAKCGDVERARCVFDKVHERDIMAWTAMISGYVKSGSLVEALELFHVMKLEKMKPNGITMVNLLLGCAEAGALDIGKWLHAYIDKEGAGYDVVLNTSLIDMYTKCGDIDEAYKIFLSAHDKDICMWNAMINGLALHGHGKEALRVFSQMEEEKILPNNVTCIGILHACSHSGLVEEGRDFFHWMVHKFGIFPTVEHYGCMVDLLGRTGCLTEAHEMINGMPMEPNIAVWGALLAGCKLHKNSELAEEASRQILELEPQNCGYNVLLSNIYAVENRWNDVTKIRKAIEGKGIKKAPGLSSIEINGSLHEFAMGDDTHPQSKQIHVMLMEMNIKLRSVGHVPITSAALVNADEEEKETALAFHSERLAIAFGLLSTAPRTPLRIMKNLRICSDCHAVTKLLSRIYDRMIIVRDRNRFHHFKDGQCSCGDYW